MKDQLTQLEDAQNEWNEIGANMSCPVCGSHISSHNIAAEWECNDCERWVDGCSTCGWMDDSDATVYYIDENGNRFDENGEPA